jgi:RNA polymerase I-specific transcription initiation factor RRN7
MSSDRCPTCNSTRWVNNHDGNERCQVCGFLRPITLENDSDEGEYVLSMGTRTVRKKEKREKAQKYFKGFERNRFHLLSHQVILRKQVWQMVNELDLPQELEELVRGLWEARVEKLAEGGKLDASVRAEFSTQDPDKSDTEAEEGQYGYDPIPMDSMPVIVDTIMFCYLGCYILRQPIFLGDFLRWIQKGKFTYLNAYDALPEPMRERLDGLGMKRTVRRQALEEKRLGMRIYRGILGFEKDMGLVLPPLNVPLCLIRMIQELALPLEVYTATKVIARISGNEFLYPTTTAVNGVRRIPDRCLVGCLITAVLLLYPFDEKTRLPTRNNEAAVAVINWEKWATKREELEKANKDKDRPLTHNEGLEITEIDAIYMNETQTDRYLDWFEDTFVDMRSFMFNQDKDAFTREMLQLFPQHPSTKAPTDHNEDTTIKDASSEAALKDTQANLIINKPTSDTDVLRPGQATPQYRTFDSLPKGPARTFYKAAAELVGITVVDLVDMVKLTQDLAHVWAIRERTARREAGEKRGKLGVYGRKGL